MAMVKCDCGKWIRTWLPEEWDAYWQEHVDCPLGDPNEDEANNHAWAQSELKPLARAWRHRNDAV